MAPNWKQLLDHVMAVPEGVVEHWNSTDGWDNVTQYGAEYGENGVSWCVEWDWDMYHDVGLDSIVPKTDNVGVFSDWAKQNGLWSAYPSIGAWVNFSNSGHTEIVVGFDADMVYTKGGNSVQAGSTDAGQGNGVWSHATPRRSARVVGYFAPRFPDGQCPPTADPNDPRGGQPQASYSWTGPDPTTAPNPAPTPEEDPLAGITLDDIRAVVGSEIENRKSDITHDVLFWLQQALSTTPADPGQHPLRWVIGPLGQELRALGASLTEDQVAAAVSKALAGGLQLTVTTAAKGA